MIIKKWVSTDYLNYDDMNRIETNINTLYDLVLEIDSTASVPTIVTNRTYTSIDTVSSLNRIESNIANIDNYYPIQNFYWDTPKTNWKAWDSITYMDLNRIEGNIEAIYNTLCNYLDHKADIIYVGQIYAKEDKYNNGNVL